MYFTFKINNETLFRAKLHSIQCEANTKAGIRCKRKCVIGSPFCNVHLKYDHDLQIKKSLIPNAGKGLFAIDPHDKNGHEVIFKKGDTIANYNGEIIDRNELINRYGDGEETAPYAIQISQNRFEDASIIRGIGSLANTKANHNNSTISLSRGFARLKATKNIRNGDEIYLSYGRAYRLNDPGVSYSTTAR